MNENGVPPGPETSRLRWLWLGGSIISERDNPLVPTNRLVIHSLVERGQEIEFLEPADHPAFIDRLRAEGSGFYRAFLAEFPKLRYRRYDMPRSHERDVWLSREAALVDVVVVEAGAPPEVFAWLDRVEERSFVRLLLASAAPGDSQPFDLVAAPEGADCRYVIVETPIAAAAQADRLLAAVISARAELAPQEMRS